MNITKYIIPLISVLPCFGQNNSGNITLGSGLSFAKGEAKDTSCCDVIIDPKTYTKEHSPSISPIGKFSPITVVKNNTTRVLYDTLTIIYVDSEENLKVCRGCQVEIKNTNGITTTTFFKGKLRIREEDVIYIKPQ